MTRLPRFGSALATSTLLLLGAAACGSDGTTVSTADGSVEIDEEDGTASFEDDEGNAFTSSTDLPDGFPSDEVPLIDGAIVQGLAIDQDSQRGYTVTIDVASSPQEAFDEARDLLEDAGYGVAMESTSGGAATGGFESDVWTVLVTSTPIDGGSSVSYIIGESGSF